MKLFDIISISLLLGLSFVLAATFFQAYASGGLITIDINEYGEAPYEAVIIVLALIGGAVTIARSIIRITERR